MDEQWKEYEGDFNAMTDEEIEREFNTAMETISEQGSWTEAVISWRAAGCPRSKDGGDAS